jgi:hypothetical protein
MAQLSNIDNLFDAYLHSASLNDVFRLIPGIIDYFVSYGDSNFRLNFWTKLDIDQKERFVNALFNFMIEADPANKLILLDLLHVLYIDAEGEVRQKVIYIFYAALLNKKNYKLALAALNFFIHLWKNSDETDQTRKEIFPKLLDFIDNSDPLLVSEGIFETLKLLDDCEARDRERVFEVVIEVAEKIKDPEGQYAAFDGLSEIILNYLGDLETYPPKLLTEKIVGLLTKNHHLKHPKALFALFRLVFANKFLLDEEAEKAILSYLKKIFKHLTFEYQMGFWQSVFDFLQCAGYIPKDQVIKPFLKKLKHLFTHRSEIAPEVTLVMENMVTWLWDNQILEEKDRADFY